MNTIVLPRNEIASAYVGPQEEAGAATPPFPPVTRDSTGRPTAKMPKLMINNHCEIVIGTEQALGAKTQFWDSEPGASEPLETLALDFGTQTGWAHMIGDKIVDSGTWQLAEEIELAGQRRQGKERTGDIRFRRLMEFVQKATGSNIRRVVYEDVIFDRSQAQTQLWASLRAVAWVFGQLPQNVVRCVPVATLKKFATGNGGADKLRMAMALAEADPTQYVLDLATGVVRRGCWALDENEVDAIWVARFTAAVDRGEADFLSVFAKKQARKLEQRARKTASKAARKALQESQEVTRRKLVAAIKTMGKCCGVYRKPGPRGCAICPRCYTAARVPRSAPTA